MISVLCLWTRRAPQEGDMLHVLEGRLLRLLVVGACVVTLGASLLHSALWVATV